MTSNRNLKRRVRVRAAKTGESYAAALRHVRPAHQGDTMPEVILVRLATAQVVVREDPATAASCARAAATCASSCDRPAGPVRRFMPRSA